MIDTIYKDDAALCADPCIEALHTELSAVLLNPLPGRYDQFRTKTGVARFALDLIHHCVVRHEVYGTTGVRAALDPRVAKTQVPRDGGTQGVDEWRSLACVALATARARFPAMLCSSDPDEAGKTFDFTYLLEGVDARYVPGMKSAFDNLQRDLEALEVKWHASPAEKKFNYDYFRAVPSELQTGPGY